MEKLILFLRDTRLPEHVKNPLEQAGWRLHSIPVLTFEFEQWRERLTLALQGNYHFCVLPSQRAVEAAHLAGNLRKDAVWLAVGTATAACAAKKLGKIPEIIGEQGAKEVVALAQSRYDFLGKTVLYLCGDNQLTLPYSLLEASVLLETCCYSTVAISPEEFSQQFYSLPTPSFIVFFSPSGVKAFKNSLAEAPRTHTKFIALGKTTEQALLELFGKCDFLPIEANLESIRDLIMGLDNCI